MAAEPPHDDDDDDDDDDGAAAALNWDGETDASHVAGPKPPRLRRPGRERKPARAPIPASGVDAPVVDDAGAPTSSFLLVTYGILAGAYGLYAIGWLVSVLRSTLTLDSLLSEIMYQFGEFLAIAAAPVWFAAVFYLTRGRRPIARLLWLLVGLVLLAPVPLVLGV
ncbi:MAG: hypothetical protein JWM50_61 [Microbacteriaceae bacterium]|nr:hypothetical protein [Microbacteriaceae bacterium]